MSVYKCVQGGTVAGKAPGEDVVDVDNQFCLSASEQEGG